MYTFCFNFLPQGLHLLPHNVVVYKLFSLRYFIIISYIIIVKFIDIIFCYTKVLESDNFPKLSLEPQTEIPESLFRNFFLVSSVSLEFFFMSLWNIFLVVFLIFEKYLLPYSSEGECWTIHSRRSRFETNSNFLIQGLAPARGIVSRQPAKLKISCRVSWDLSSTL